MRNVHILLFCLGFCSREQTLCVAFCRALSRALSLCFSFGSTGIPLTHLCVVFFSLYVDASEVVKLRADASYGAYSLVHKLVTLSACRRTVSAPWQPTSLRSSPGVLVTPSGSFEVQTGPRSPLEPLATPTHEW